MALQPSDLLVVQSQADSKLYKLRVSDLDTYIEASTGIQFRGSVDLNNAPSAQNPAITLPATNGDLYVVESDAVVIQAGWIMDSGVTSAQENDRIIWDADSNYWVLVTGGTNTGGTVTDITATLPLKTDGDQVNPVISIRAARTTTGATLDGDGEGTAGTVARLAEASDVAYDNGSPDATAVVTADLLQATNATVEALVLAPGGVTSVTEGTDADNVLGALEIPTSTGAVTVQVKAETFAPFDFSALDDINA